MKELRITEVIFNWHVAGSQHEGLGEVFDKVVLGRSGVDSIEQMHEHRAFRVRYKNGRILELYGVNQALWESEQMFYFEVDLGDTEEQHELKGFNLQQAFNRLMEDAGNEDQVGWNAETMLKDKGIKWSSKEIKDEDDIDP